MHTKHNPILCNINIFGGILHAIPSASIEPQPRGSQKWFMASYIWITSFACLHCVLWWCLPLVSFRVPFINDRHFSSALLPCLGWWDIVMHVEKCKCKSPTRRSVFLFHIKAFLKFEYDNSRWIPQLSNYIARCADTDSPSTLYMYLSSASFTILLWFTWISRWAKDIRERERTNAKWGKPYRNYSTKTFRSCVDLLLGHQ